MLLDPVENAIALKDFLCKTAKLHQFLTRCKEIEAVNMTQHVSNTILDLIGCIQCILKVFRPQKHLAFNLYPLMPDSLKITKEKPQGSL